MGCVSCILSEYHLDKFIDKLTDEYDRTFLFRENGTWGVHDIALKLDQFVYVDINHFI